MHPRARKIDTNQNFTERQFTIVLPDGTARTARYRGETVTIAF